MKYTVQTFPTRRLTWTPTPTNKTTNFPPITQPRLVRVRSQVTLLFLFSFSIKLYKLFSSNSQELEDMRKRLKEIEEEASALREMQAKVEKEMGAVQGRFICFILSDLFDFQRYFCVLTSIFVFFVVFRLKIRLVHLQLKLKRKKWMLGQSMLVM